jgi:type II secretory pathway pseudopilin PulG
MNLKNRRALTLVESMVSIALLGAFLCSFLGAFFVSRLSTERARHRVTAMNILKQYMEREIEAGFPGGEDGDGDHYVTVTSVDPESIIPSVLITVDNKVYTLRPDPYFRDNIEDPVTHNALTYENTPYKIVGFVITWTEDILGSGVGPTCSERSVVYLSNHGA